jgi:chromosome partitioning protein
MTGLRCSRYRSTSPTAAQLGAIPTAIIDLDPQPSAPNWADSRSQPPEAVAIPPARLNNVLDKLRGGGCGFAVIDTGRDSNNAGYPAAQAADLVLIPCRWSDLHLRFSAERLRSGVQSITPGYTTAIS